MTRRIRLAAFSTLALVVGVALAPRAEAVPETILVIAGPLAEHYGVSGPAVTNLLEQGVSLEGVTPLLLVKESAGREFNEVTAAYEKSGQDIRKTAEQFDVAAETYSAENVDAAIARAKSDAAQSASDKAAEETGKAVDSLLGGFGK